MKKFRMGDKFVAQIGLGYWSKKKNTTALY